MKLTILSDSSKVFLTDNWRYLCRESSWVPPCNFPRNYPKNSIFPSRFSLRNAFVNASKIVLWSSTGFLFFYFLKTFVFAGVFLCFLFFWKRVSKTDFSSKIRPLHDYLETNLQFFPYVFLQAFLQDISPRMLSRMSPRILDLRSLRNILHGFLLKLSEILSKLSSGICFLYKESLVELLEIPPVLFLELCIVQFLNGLVDKNSRINWSEINY